MSICQPRKRPGVVMLLVVFFCTTLLPIVLRAQTNDDAQEIKRKISELVKQENYVQALPLLEKIVVLNPEDHEMHLQLGFALLAQTNVTPNADERKALRVRARAAFVKAKQTGDNHPVVEALIDSIPPDGSEGAEFSSNKEASNLMDQAEAFFSQGKLDEALAYYQKALVPRSQAL